MIKSKTKKEKCKQHKWHPYFGHSKWVNLCINCGIRSDECVCPKIPCTVHAPTPTNPSPSQGWEEEFKIFWRGLGYISVDGYKEEKVFAFIKNLLVREREKKLKDGVWTMTEDEFKKELAKEYKRGYDAWHDEFNEAVENTKKK